MKKFRQFQPTFLEIFSIFGRNTGNGGNNDINLKLRT